MMTNTVSSLHYIIIPHSVNYAISLRDPNLIYWRQFYVIFLPPPAVPQPSASRSTPLVSPPTRVKYGKAGINYRGDALRLRIAPVGEIHLQITCTVHCSGPLPSKDQLTEDFRTSFAKIVNQILETQVKRGWSNEEVKDNMGETVSVYCCYSHSFPDCWLAQHVTVTNELERDCNQLYWWIATSNVLLPHNASSYPFNQAGKSIYNQFIYGWCKDT